MLLRTISRPAAATATANVHAAPATRGFSGLAAVAAGSAASSARPAAVRRGWMSLAAVGGAALLAAYGMQTTAEAAPAASGLDDKEFVPLTLLKVSGSEQSRAEQPQAD